MRTTVTLEGDVEYRLREFMREHGLTFKQAVNEAIRRGLTRPPEEQPVPSPTFSMGFDPAIPWDKALRLAAEIENEELARRLAVRR